MDNLDAQKKDEGKSPEQQDQPPKDELGPMVPQLSKLGKDATDAQKKQQETAEKKTDAKLQAQDTKLNVQPSKNGMHACPICGYVHAPGGPHVNPQQPEQPEQPNQAKPPESNPPTSSDGNITQNGVLNAIGKIHQNVQKQTNNKKFRNGF